MIETLRVNVKKLEKLCENHMTHCNRQWYCYKYIEICRKIVTSSFVVQISLYQIEILPQKNMDSKSNTSNQKYFHSNMAFISLTKCRITRLLFSCLPVDKGILQLMITFMDMRYMIHSTTTWKTNNKELRFKKIEPYIIKICLKKINSFLNKDSFSYQTYKYTFTFWVSE